jgi:hypothetical protein
MSYKSEQIFRNVTILFNTIEDVEAKVLFPYKSQIKQLPLEQQKSEWYKVNMIEKLIDAAHMTTMYMSEHIETMHTSQEFESQKRYIEALRKYIRDLGGNPTNVNYYKPTDI